MSSVFLSLVGTVNLKPVCLAAVSWCRIAFSHNWNVGLVGDLPSRRTTTLKNEILWRLLWWDWPTAWSKGAFNRAIRFPNTENGLCGEIDLCSEIKVFKNFIKNAFLERVFIYLFFTVNENKTASLLILHFKWKRTVVERLKFSFTFFPLMW